MKNAPAAAILAGTFLAPASADAIPFDIGVPPPSEKNDNSPKPENPVDIAYGVRWHMANLCENIRVSDVTTWSPKGSISAKRAYFYARPRGPEAEACMAQAIQRVLTGLHDIRFRSSVDPDHTDGRHIVIVDQNPHRKTGKRGR